MALPDFLKDDFSRFAFTADDWLVSYAHLSASFVTVYPTTFSMAMILELYLKAYIAFLEGNGTNVTAHGHDICSMYKKLMDEDPLFPTEIRLFPDLSKNPIFELDRDNWQSKWFLALTQEIQTDIRENYEIYLAMAYVVDLKYGVSPAPKKNAGRIISSSWTSLNPWIAKFVVTIRKRIGHPQNKLDDCLHYTLNHRDLHPRAKVFLEEIYDETFR